MLSSQCITFHLKHLTSGGSVLFFYYLPFIIIYSMGGSSVYLDIIALVSPQSDCDSCFLQGAVLVLIRQLCPQVLVSCVVHNKIQGSMNILYNCVLGFLLLTLSFPPHPLGQTQRKTVTYKMCYVE